MGKVFTRIQRWWRVARGRPVPQVPYEVACACGKVAVGTRIARHQILRCAGCGRRLFVLPFSRLPPVQEERGAQGVGLASRSALRVSTLSQLRLPLTAGVITFVVVAVAISFVVNAVRHPQSKGITGAAVIAERTEAGRLALAEGNFRTAASELAAAVSLRERYPEALSLAERRQLNQLQRQAALLADLLFESLGDILQAAERTEPEEWRAQFKVRFLGKAVVFDDEVRRDPAGGCHLLGYRIFDARSKPARVDLSNLQVLRSLPLDQPKRLLFGARLAEVRLEAGGSWVIRFEPDSGVLITDAGAASACCPLAPDEFKALREVVERQAGWSVDLP